MNRNSKPKNFFPQTYSELLRIGKDESKTAEVINEIKSFVERYGRNITTSQLRNIYSKITSLNDDNISGLQLVRPKLAYIAARQKNRQAREFIGFMDEMVSKIEDAGQFRSFKIFFESVVAYHKYYHDKR